VAPLIGAAIAGVAYPYLFGTAEELADRPVRDDALPGGSPEHEYSETQNPAGARLAPGDVRPPSTDR
jgi:hypothetical protein